MNQFLTCSGSFSRSTHFCLPSNHSGLNSLTLSLLSTKRTCILQVIYIHTFSESAFRSDQLLSCVRLFATPWIAAHQASLSITNSRTSLRLTSIESVTPSIHLILCCSLLLLPPIPPSIRVFSNESTLRMTWPKYWSFSFSIIPSKEIPGLISKTPWNCRGFQGHSHQEILTPKLSPHSTYSNWSKVLFQCSSQFMAPVDSVSGKQISAMSLWLSLQIWG